MLKRQEYFSAPPFVVWRIATERPNNEQMMACSPSAKGDAASSENQRGSDNKYKLIPHAVYCTLLLNTLAQWLAFLFIVYQRKRTDLILCPHDALGALLAHCSSQVADLMLVSGSFVIFFMLAVCANVGIQIWLNWRSHQPVETLLLLASREPRKKFESVFPLITHSKNLGLLLWGLNHLSPTFEETVFWLRRIFVWNEATSWASKLYRLLPRKFRNLVRRRLTNERLVENVARLHALELRQEDSCLHALSAFAIVNCFIPVKGERSRGEIQIRFLMCYFSPVIFGFVLCLVIFATNCFMPADHFAYMISIFFWFLVSLVYAVRTLNQDFASQFKNYFNSRAFPRDMTAFANRQMSAAPDLVDLAQSKWLSTVVTIGIAGLTSLYAAFLQSLSP